MKDKPKKTPVIRRGQKKPFRKAPAAEIELRIEWLAKEMVLNPALTRYGIHEKMCPRYNLDWRTVDVIYINRARKLLKDRARMTTEEARRIGVNLLIDIICNGTPREKLAAEHRLAEVFGYNQPRQSVVSGPAGGP